MPSRLRIGLTGGIASGKSTAATRFAELGISVIDADESSRRVVASGTSGLAQVIARFGEGMRTATGELDRKALRELVFNDTAARRELEAILHPLIRSDMEGRAAAAAGPYLVMAIPLLVEGDSKDRVDRILVVDLDESLQLQRVMARDHCSLEQARAILDSQASRSERLRAADDVLLNSGTVSELRQAVDTLHRQYLQLAAVRPSSKELN